MTVTQARKIGSRQGLMATGLGLFIAQIMMTFLFSTDEGFIKAFFWFADFDYWLNILIGAVIFLVCGHLYGQLAGQLILKKKWSTLLTGFLMALAVLLTTTFFASWTGFIQEGIDDIGYTSNPFFDYIFKPMYWVTMVGLIPALIVGAWFGARIKRKGKEEHDSQYSI